MAHLKVPCNGWLVHAIPFLVTFTAFILSAVGARSCRFLNSQNEVSGLRYFGIFQYDTGEGGPCMNINFLEYRFTFATDGPPEDFAASQHDFYIAQVGAIMAITFGALITLVLFVSFFYRLPPRFFKVFIAFWLMFAVVGCGLTFQTFQIYWCGEGQFFDTDSGAYRNILGKCFIETGGMLMAVASGLYFMAAIVVCLMDAPSIAMIEFSRTYEAVKADECIDDERRLEMSLNTVVNQETTTHDEVMEVQGLPNSSSN